MSIKLPFYAHSVIANYCRGFHTSVFRNARGSRFPTGPIEYVENQLLAKTSPVSEISKKVDDLEEQAIELTREEVITEIHTIKENTDLKKSVNEDVPPFEKLSDADKSLGILMMRAKKESKLEGKLLALEGRRLIEDALDAGLNGHSVYFSEKDTVRCMQLPEKSTTKFFKVPFKNIKLWSTVTTCPGITGFFHHPKPHILKTLVSKATSENNVSINLVCDNIRDPGNMGTIMRTAAGAGCNQVILTKGCVNIWENKVLRSSMGSIFRLPIVQKAPWKDIEDLIVAEEAAVFLADSNMPVEKTENYLDADYVVEGKPIVLVVGGETRGLSREAHKLITVAKNHAKIHVPLACGVESLNVAAAVAVLLFEIRRQRRNLSKIHSQQ